MESEVQRNPYRDAYMAANTELDEIMEQCARLRARKEHVEVAAAALRALVEIGGQTIPVNQPERSVPAESVGEMAAPGPVPVPTHAEMQPAPAEAWAASPAEPAMKEIPGGFAKRIASVLERTAFA